MKSSNSTQASSNLYQPRVLLTIWQKRLLQKPTKTVYPLDAKEVFINEKEATDFFPIYINDLIKKGLLDKDLVFTKDNKINEDYIQTCVVTLTITRLELEP